MADDIEVITKYREWSLHTASCSICRFFEQRPQIRVVCDDGRAILIQILLLLDELSRI